MVRLAQTGETFPFKKFNKTISSLTRKQTSIILQLCSGHFPLNYYLFKIKKVASALCQACLASHPEEPAHETIKHYIFECPAYTQARTTFKQKISRNRFNLPGIMSKSENI